MLHVRRWQRFAGARKSPEHAPACLGLARFRELHAGDAAPAPGDTASADRRVEKRKAVARRHRLLAAEPLDELHLARVVDGVASDAKHELEALGVRQWRLRSARRCSVSTAAWIWGQARLF